MSPRRTQNLDMLAAVAKGLRGLKEKVVFVGGATIDLYLDDPTVAGARPTDDVDCVVELTTRTQYYDLEEQLRALDFKHPMTQRGPVCRWTYSGITVDVMPTHGEVLGFNNRWYPDGVAQAVNAQLPDGQTIWIFSAPYLLASKLEAFFDRGKDDLLISQDLEDILAVLDASDGIERKILDSPAPLRSYLREKFAALLANEKFIDAVPGHVKGDGRPERLLALLRRLTA